MLTFLDYLLGGVASGAVVALVGLAIVLIWRSSRVVNFAQVGQAMITTFVAYSVQRVTGSWLLALVVGLLSGAVLGLLVYLLVLRPVRRLDTSGAIIATFGVLIALQAAAAMIWGGDMVAYPQPFSASGISLFGRVWPLSVYDLIVVAAAALLVVVLSMFLTRTNVGLAMRASAVNPEVVRLSGINVNRMLALGWAMAGVVGSLAGVLIAPITSLSPNTFDLLLILGFTTAVLGGLDSLVGAVAFGMSTALVVALVTGYSSADNAPIVALALLAITLIVKPGGFFAHETGRQV